MEGLDTSLMLVVAGTLVAWGFVSARVERLNVSAPLAFVVFGLVLANGPQSVVDIDLHGETLRSLTEVTLALLLFSDAARVNLRVLRQDSATPLRLLFIGLPITIAIGAAAAVVLFPDLNPWAAAGIAAAVAPTDAALGAQVVEDRHVPSRIRRMLNVESGLNDGIATPFVMFFIAGAVADTVANSSASLGGSVGDLGIGVLAGVGVGLLGGWLLTFTATRGWAIPAYRGIATLALALAAYSLSLEMGGNGFIAAFVGGLAFGTVVPERDHEATLEFDAQAGELLSLIVWFLFGATMLSALDATTWQTVVFALVALTAARMLPVALVLARKGFTGATVAFVGWFGPRGLASVVFALIALDSLEGPDARTVISAITLTVIASVAAHGISAQPLSRRYGEQVARLRADAPERADVPAVPTRPQSSAGRHNELGHRARPTEPA